MTTYNQNIILFEIDRPRYLLSPLYFDPDAQLPLSGILNFEPGIWFYVMTPGIVAVTDDNENEGYYHYLNAEYYNIATLKVNDISYKRVNSLTALRATDSSWFYDPESTKLYIHFKNWAPPLNKEIVFGTMMGYSWKESQNCYYDDQYYEPRINKLFPIKKSIDPLFWGLLKFQAAKIELINNDGGLDNWETMNLFAQTATLSKGNEGDDYDDFEIIYKGFIENNGRSFEKFGVNIQDERKSFTRKICINTFNQNDYTLLDDGDVGSPKPIAYGKIYRAPCLCLNPGTLSSGYYYYYICDTTYYNISALTKVYAGSKSVTVAGSNLATGLFWVAGGQFADNNTDVTADFTATTLDNGVSVIIDLMTKWGGVDYTSEFWDTTETDAAIALAPDVGIYINNPDKMLSDIIAEICTDIDARFFQHDNGLWTIRLYNEDREPDAVIYADEWLDEPDISNNASQFLTSVKVGYQKKQNSEKGTYVTITDYEADEDYPFTSTETYLHDIYKSYKTATFETNLITKTAAKEKAKAIMRISGNIQDIINRTTTMNHADLEITDFVYASPRTRYSEAELWGVYEIMEIQKDYEKNNIKLSLRYVKEYISNLSANHSLSATITQTGSLTQTLALSGSHTLSGLTQSGTVEAV